MRILVYKRTHIGDPNKQGQFGCHNCMGQVRANNYDAVIGIGAMHPWRGINIASKITWIGVGTHKMAILPGDRNPIVTFEKFALFDENGDMAPPSLHPARLPRHVILFEGKVGYEEAYHDAKSLIDRLMSGNLNYSKNDENANTASPTICRSRCKK